MFTVGSTTLFTPVNNLQPLLMFFLGLLVNYAKPAAKLNELFFLRPARLAALIAKVVSFLNAINNLKQIERSKLRHIIVKEGFSESIVPQILR